MKILVRNNLDINVRLEDYQIVLPRKEIMDLTNVLPLITILTNNFDLQNLIINKSISINDGERCLDIEEALNYISLDYWDKKLDKIDSLNVIKILIDKNSCLDIGFENKMYLENAGIQEGKTSNITLDQFMYLLKSFKTLAISYYEEDDFYKLNDVYDY